MLLTRLLKRFTVFLSAFAFSLSISAVEPSIDAGLQPPGQVRIVGLIFPSVSQTLDQWEVKRIYMGDTIPLRGKGKGEYGKLGLMADLVILIMGDSLHIKSEGSFGEMGG